MVTILAKRTDVLKFVGQTFLVSRRTGLWENSVRTYARLWHVLLDTVQNIFVELLYRVKFKTDGKILHVHCGKFCPKLVLLSCPKMQKNWVFSHFSITSHLDMQNLGYLWPGARFFNNFFCIFRCCYKNRNKIFRSNKWSFSLMTTIIITSHHTFEINMKFLISFHNF